MEEVPDYIVDTQAVYLIAQNRHITTFFSQEYPRELEGTILESEFRGFIEEINSLCARKGRILKVVIFIYIIVLIELVFFAIYLLGVAIIGYLVAMYGVVFFFRKKMSEVAERRGITMDYLVFSQLYSFSTPQLKI